MEYDVKIELLAKSEELFGFVNKDVILKLVEYLSAAQNYLNIVPGSIKKEKDDEIEIKLLSEDKFLIKFYDKQEALGFSTNLEKFKFAKDNKNRPKSIYQISLNLIGINKNVKLSFTIDNLKEYKVDSLFYDNDGIYFMDNKSIRYYELSTLKYLDENKVSFYDEINIKRMGIVPDKEFEYETINNVFAFFVNPKEVLNKKLS